MVQVPSRKLLVRKNRRMKLLSNYKKLPTRGGWRFLIMVSSANSPRVENTPNVGQTSLVTGLYCEVVSAQYVEPAWRRCDHSQKNLPNSVGTQEPMAKPRSETPGRCKKAKQSTWLPRRQGTKGGELGDSTKGGLCRTHKDPIWTGDGAHKLAGNCLQRRLGKVSMSAGNRACVEMVQNRLLCIHADQRERVHDRVDLAAPDINDDRFVKNSSISL